MGKRLQRVKARFRPAVGWALKDNVLFVIERRGKRDKPLIGIQWDM